MRPGFAILRQSPTNAPLGARSHCGGCWAEGKSASYPQANEKPVGRGEQEKLWGPVLGGVKRHTRVALEVREQRSEGLTQLGFHTVLLLSRMDWARLGWACGRVGRTRLSSLGTLHQLSTLICFLFIRDVPTYDLSSTLIRCLEILLVPGIQSPPGAGSPLKGWRSWWLGHTFCQQAALGGWRRVDLAHCSQRIPCPRQHDAQHKY